MEKRLLIATSPVAYNQLGQVGGKLMLTLWHFAVAIIRNRKLLGHVSMD